MKIFLGWLFCLMIAPAALLAQNSDGAIQGSVLDQVGASISGVAVTARNLDTGLTVKTTTTDAGLYSFPNLPPGQYSVTAEAPGMKTAQQTGVAVQTATTTALDIPMALGSTTETVTVSASASPLQTNTSDIGSTIQQSLMENLPLEVSGTIRNPVQFITLVPGFVGNVGNNPGDNSSDDYKLNGGQEGGTDILVDGLSISLVGPNTQQNKGVSPEAVQEFKTLQSNFSAEYGQSGDGIVSLSVKSGTNKFHGDVYDLLRNSALDANSWTNNTAGQPKNLDIQNDFGALVSGPVWLPHIYNGKDRTFFMFNYEGFRFQTGGSGAQSFPNEAFRKGDLSALCTTGFTAAGVCNDLTKQLYDPTTHAAIPNDILTNDPNFKASSVMTKVFSYLPATNGSLTNNVFQRTTSATTANLFDVKVDHSISDKQRVTVGFDYDNTNTGSVNSLGPIFGGHTPQKTRYARLSHDYIFTPSLLNHFLAGYSRRFRGEVSNGLGQGFPQKLGLMGVQNTTFPCIKFHGGPYDSVLNNCGDSEFADNVFQFADAVNWIHGKHDFKFGGELRALQFNVRRLTQSSGEFDFNNPETSLNGVGGDPIASALFGLVDQTTLNYGSFSGVRYKDFAFYAQDTYKFTPKLTLNYGLRYDYDIPATEAFNRFSVVDPMLANPGAGNIPGAYTYFGTGTGRNGRTRPQDVYTKDFGPRVGFAYSWNDKTVLRGGYGIFYEPLKEPSFADQDGLGFFNKENLNTPIQIDAGVPHLFPVSGPFTPEGQNGNGGVVLAPRGSGRTGDIQSWNLDVQRQISTSLLLDVAYVGSKGSHLPALNIIPNQTDPRFLSLGNDLNMDVSCLANGTCPNAIAAGVKVPFAGFSALGGIPHTIAQALRPFPQYGNFVTDDNSFGYDRSGNSTYHALQARLTKRFAAGLSFLVSYTMSKNITDADSMGPGVSGFTGNGGFVGQNSYNRRAEKAVSQLDTPQALVASFFYELPTGHGKTYLNSTGVFDRAVSGWSVSGIASYSSGIPTSVYGPCGGTAGGVLFGGCGTAGANARVNVIPGVSEINKSGSFRPDTTPFFNAAAFSLAAPFTFGNEPRALDHARTFGGINEDFTLEKKTHLLGENSSVDFHADFFNLFNRHIYSAPNGAFATPLNSPFQAARTPGCSGPFSCGFGAVTGASGPRTIQLGLKISY